MTANALCDDGPQRSIDSIKLAGRSILTSAESSIKSNRRAISFQILPLDIVELILFIIMQKFGITGTRCSYWLREMVTIATIAKGHCTQSSQYKTLQLVLINCLLEVHIYHSINIKI